VSEIEVIQATVYRAGGRRYFTRAAAIHRAAHLSVRTEMGCPNGRQLYVECDCAFHALTEDDQQRAILQRHIEIEQRFIRERRLAKEALS
jgi:hypothetical protein